jgi:hypothetical protein
VSKLIVFLLLFAVSNTYAFWGPITFIPANPTANDSIQFQIQTGGCDTFLSESDAEIEVTGSVVKVTKRGISNLDPIFCFFPISAGTTSIGRFPSGTYRFELYRRENLRPTFVDLVQTANLTIAPAPNAALVAAPTLSWPGLSFLVIVFLLVGASFIARGMKSVRPALSE